MSESNHEQKATQPEQLDDYSELSEAIVKELGVRMDGLGGDTFSDPTQERNGHTLTLPVIGTVEAFDALNSAFGEGFDEAGYRPPVLDRYTSSEGSSIYTMALSHVDGITQDETIIEYTLDEAGRRLERRTAFANPDFMDQMEVGDVERLAGTKKGLENGLTSDVAARLEGYDLPPEVRKEMDTVSRLQEEADDLNTATHASLRSMRNQEAEQASFTNGQQAQEVAGITVKAGRVQQELDQARKSLADGLLSFAEQQHDDGLAVSIKGLRHLGEASNSSTESALRARGRILSDRNDVVNDAQPEVLTEGSKGLAIFKRVVETLSPDVVAS